MHSCPKISFGKETYLCYLWNSSFGICQNVTQDLCKLGSQGVAMAISDVYSFFWYISTICCGSASKNLKICIRNDQTRDGGCFLSAFIGKEKINEIWFPKDLRLYKQRSEWTWIAPWTLQLCALKYVNVQVCWAPGQILLGWITFMELETLPLVALLSLGNSTFLNNVFDIFWCIKCCWVLVQMMLEMQQWISIYISANSD